MINILNFPPRFRYCICVDFDRLTTKKFSFVVLKMSTSATQKLNYFEYGVQLLKKKLLTI